VRLALRVAAAAFELGCIGGMFVLVIASAPFWLAWLIGQWRKQRRTTRAE